MTRPERLERKPVMTVREAGKKGGEAVKAKYGPEFYAGIGRKGGIRVNELRGSEFFSKIGKKGGESLKSRVAVEDPGYYVRIGQMRAQAKQERNI